MATIGESVLTLLDWGKRLDPYGKTEMTAELLAQTNEILEDMLWKEGNLPTGERVSIRTGLPTVYWRQLNVGVPSSKSTTAQVDEQCGILEAWSEVDKDLAELNGNVNSFRFDEGKAFLEAMNIEFAQTLFYGTSANPEEFVGLSSRYSDLTAANGENIISAGGTGSDNSSIWLIGWGGRSVYGTFPKGSMAGLDHEDFGLQTVETSAGVGGNRMRAYQERWCWKGGLVVKDWRYAVRIANIDISATVADPAGSSVDLGELMIDALHHLPTTNDVKPVFYMNRTLAKMIDIQTQNKSNAYFTVGNEQGKRKIDFRGVPIKVCDALTETEGVVS